MQVGDCYVAVSGLPEPNPEHAVVMTRFARDIIANMRTKSKELEVLLGPDTGELDLRIGMHSGQVTVRTQGAKLMAGPCRTRYPHLLP